MSRCHGEASRRLTATFIAAVVLLGVSAGRAGTFTWDGGGGDNNWSTALNWGGAAPGNPAAPDDLVFAGNTRVAPNVDAPWSGIQSIDFTGATAGFTLGGSAITFTGTGAVSNVTALSHTIGNDLIGGATALNVTQNAAANQLTFGGTINLGAGGGLNITPTAGTTIFNGIISGGAAVTVNAGAGIVELNAANTYGGGTTVTGGTLQGTTTSLQGAMTNNAAVVFDQAGDGTYAGVMIGGGAVTKAGAGTVTFSGNNTYGGGTTVTAGTLALGHAEGAGTGAINMNGGNLEFNTAGSPDFDNAVTATLAFDLTVTQDATLSGVMGGGGAVTKAGAGTVTFSGNNTYGGGTTVTAGTLALGHAEGAGTGAINMNGGNLEFNTAGSPDFDNAVTATLAFDLTVTQDATLSGVLGGGGAVTKLGAGTLTFSGANNYTGGTTVTAGTLQGTTTSLQGAMTNNAAVVFDQAGDGTYAGAISGGGSVAKNGAGTVTFSGANTYGGGTTVTGGTLQGTTTSLQGDMTNNAAVVFDQAGDGTYAGAISGGGSVAKNGAGTVTFSGANTYGGGTTVNAGTLVVNGSLGAGLATIEPGTTLAGSGQIGGNVLSRGTTAPGNSIDTLRVDGNYTLAAGGTLDVEVERVGAVTNSDLVDVGGAATLEAGSTVQVTDISAGGNVIQTGDTFTIITTVGGVTDQGAAVTTGSAVLNFTSAVVGTDYILTAHQISALAAAATGGNNASVAAAIDADSATAVGDYGTLINNLLLLPGGLLDPALAQLGGQAHLAAGEAAFGSASQMTGVLTNYLGGRRTGAPVPAGQAARGPDPSLMLASAAYDPLLLAQVIDRARQEPDEPAPAETTTYFFAQPFGDFYTKDTTANQLGYRADTAGIEFGLDRLVAPHALVGLAGGYGHTEVDVRRGGGGGRIDTFRIGPYTSLFDDRAFVDAAVSYGAHWNEMHRKMLFGGINRTAESDYLGHDMTAYLGGGYRFNLGECTVTPNASAQYTWYRRRGFSETGAGAANLNVAPDTSQSMQSRLGLSISRVFACKSVKICPEAFGGWWHEYLGDQSLQAHFAQGVTRFRTEREFCRDGAYYGAGVSVLLKKNVSAYVRWQGTVSNLAEGNAVIGGVGMRF
ncbi:MAG TPA: autotransporter domain-containing protein [Phycisphaerae bacterium]|nr:autotransporter domain-containing protein [Phycisphaerae bacterium]